MTEETIAPEVTEEVTVETVTEVTTTTVTETITETVDVTVETTTETVTEIPSNDNALEEVIVAAKAGNLDENGHLIRDAKEGAWY